MKDKIMNDEQIERLLRKAPRPPAPAELLGELQSNIALPRRAESARRQEGGGHTIARRKEERLRLCTLRYP